MWKAVLAGTTAIAIAGSTLVIAQPRTDRDLQRPDRDVRERPQMSVEDMRAYAEARLAALKAGLALTAEQEKHWPAFETAARELAKLRLDRITARRDAERELPQGQPQAQPPAQPAPPTQSTPAQPAQPAQPSQAQPQAQPQAPQPPDDPIARMRERGQRMAQTGAVLVKLAEATAPLYASLDDAQKRRFNTLSRTFMSGPRDMMRARLDRPDGPPGMRGPMRGWRDDDRDEPRSFARPPRRSQMEPRDFERTPPQRFQRDYDAPRNSPGPGRSWREDQRDDGDRHHDGPDGRRSL
jgi:hypothetical protein